MCMQQPAVKKVAENGVLETGNGKLKTERAFWEPTPERKLQHLADLAKNKLWMDIVFYARDNPDVARSAIAHLVKARREIVKHNEMRREYCRDADRILRFIAEESPYPSIGKRAVADIVWMGDTIGDEKVFTGELLTGIATGAKNYQVAMYALDQMAALGMKQSVRWVADAFIGMDMRVRKYASQLATRMEKDDLEAEGHGC